MFNVAQTNLQEARPELYKKLEAAAGVNRPLNHGDDFSFPAMDKMIKENGWICPIKPVYGDNAYYSISKNEIVIPEKRQFKDGESATGCFPFERFQQDMQQGLYPVPCHL